MNSPYEYQYNPSPKCPHCGADYSPSDPDHGLYQDDEYVDIVCPSCSKEFVCKVHIVFEYSTAVSEEAADDDAWGPRETELEEA